MADNGAMWSLLDARLLAREAVGNMPQRWAHLRASSEMAERLADSSELVTQSVVLAVTVHDIGYGDSMRLLGFHPIDGANHLQELGVSRAIVGLVAHHTGSSFEAEERGLGYELGLLPKPDPFELDVVTMIDLATGPDGTPVLDTRRLVEIIERYGDGDPVTRAIRRSEPTLLASSARGKRVLGLPDDWPLCGEPMAYAQSHGRVHL